MLGLVIKCHLLNFLHSMKYENIIVKACGVDGQIKT
jgi:hypothetical protein